MINVYEKIDGEQQQSEESKKRGRGPAKHVRDAMLISPKNGESTIGTEIIYFYYNPFKPQQRIHNGKPPQPRKVLTPQGIEDAFDVVASYCTLHGATAHRRTFGEKTIYYVRIYSDPLILKRLIAQITRAGLVGGKPNPSLADIPPDLIFPA